MSAAILRRIMSFVRSLILAPGSSLIISDHGISHETGSDTDFIVLTH
jgi:hypothetical protein